MRHWLRGWTAVPLCLVLAMRLLAQEAVSLSDVEALRKPVTVRDRMILLPDLLREVGRQTGVTLTAGREFTEDKLTVFVKDVPAVELLQHIATIVMGEWRKAKDGYLLAQTAQGRRWEEELIALERENRLQDARKSVQVYMQQAQRPYGELIQEARQKYEAMMVGRPRDVIQMPGGETVQVAGIAWLPSNLDYAELPYYLIGRLLRGFSNQQWQAFWRGEPFVASTLNLPGVLPLPEEALQWDKQSVQLRLPFGDSDEDNKLRDILLAGSEQNPTQHIVLVFALDEEAATIRSAIYRVKPLGVEPYSSMGGAAVNAEREPKHRVQNHPCLQWWNRWQTGEEEAAKAAALQAKLHLAAGERLPVSEHVTSIAPVRPYFTLADYLEWLARRTDLQIVADAYRIAMNRFSDVPFLQEGETVLGWLKRVVRPTDPYGGWWRAEGAWLLVKHKRFWELRRSELPERLLRELERKASRRQPLTLNDYAALARDMGTMHRRRLEMPEGYMVRFSLQPLDGHLPMLRFWASLNAAQQGAALRDGVLPLAALSPAQQRAFWRSAWEGVLLGTSYAKNWVFAESEQGLPSPAFTVSLSPLEKYQVTGLRTSVPLMDTREAAERMAEDLKRWSPGHEFTIRPVQVVQCRYGFLLFPNLRYSGRFDILPP